MGEVFQPLCSIELRRLLDFKVKVFISAQEVIDSIPWSQSLKASRGKRETK